MKNSKINGAVVLFVAGLIGKVLGAIYRIPLSNLLGAEGIGLYQMAFPIYSFLLTILTGGVSTFLSRQIAIYRAKNQYAQISKSYKIARNISLIYGMVVCFILVVLAFPISLLQGNANAFGGYIAISLGFIFAAVLGAFRGYFQGFEDMTPTAVSQILEQSFKLIFGLVGAFVGIKFGTIWGVFGALLGISLSELISFIYLKLKKKSVQNTYVAVQDYKYFIKQVLPIGLSYGVLPFSALIDSFLVVNLLVFGGFTTSYSTALYGVECGMILPLINMPNILISAIAITLIPAMSYNKERCQNYTVNIYNIFKFVYIFILPCSVGVFVLSKQIITVVYPTLNFELLNVASNLLKLSTFEMFFLSFVTITNAMLQGIGKTKQPLYSLVIGVIIKTLLMIVLISNTNLNIYGLTLASFVGYFVAASINVYVLKKESNFRFNIAEVLLPIVASMFMCAFIIFYLGLLNAINIITLLVVIFISAVIYFSVLIGCGLIKFKDIKNMLQKEAK